MPQRPSSRWALAPLLLALAAVHTSGDGPAAARKDQRTPEVSTAQLETILANRSAAVLDTRPHLEYAISHIPGALNVALQPGVPMSMYVSDVAAIDTRILVVGADAAAARYVAERFTQDAFHNVSYSAGSFATVHRSLTQ